MEGETIEQVRFEVKLDRPLVEMIIARGRRLTPPLDRNQTIIYLLARGLGYDRASFLAEMSSESPSTGEGSEAG